MKHFWFTQLNFHALDIRLKADQVIFKWKQMRQKTNWNDSFATK